MRFSQEKLKLAANYAVPLLICVCVTGAIGMFDGYLLWRWAWGSQAFKSKLLLSPLPYSLFPIPLN
ncbi:MAG: hypothetical protein ACRC2R_05720 [Xenococcaceae cyanobacterium]